MGLAHGFHLSKKGTSQRNAAAVPDILTLDSD
jgi:hypothetical protein